jgi:hypothetical protein
LTTFAISTRSAASFSTTTAAAASQQLPTYIAVYWKESHLDHLCHLHAQRCQLLLLAAQLHLPAAAVRQQLRVGVNSLLQIMVQLGHLAAATWKKQGAATTAEF